MLQRMAALEVVSDNSVGGLFGTMKRLHFQHHCRCHSPAAPMPPSRPHYATFRDVARPPRHRRYCRNAGFFLLPLYTLSVETPALKLKMYEITCYRAWKASQAATPAIAFPDRIDCADLMLHLSLYWEGFFRCSLGW